jgi:hypothetical protein
MSRHGRPGHIYPCTDFDRTGRTFNTWLVCKPYTGSHKGKNVLVAGWRREHAHRVWQAIQALVALADMERATLAFAQRNKHVLLCSPVRDGHYQALSRAQSFTRSAIRISRRQRAQSAWNAAQAVLAVIVAREVEQWFVDPDISSDDYVALLRKAGW